SRLIWRKFRRPRGGSALIALDNRESTYGRIPYKEATHMNASADRLDLRLSVEDKNRLRQAAELHGLPLATFVREAALREAETTIAHPPKARRGSLSSRLRGRATARLSTDQIMQHTRCA